MFESAPTPENASTRIDQLFDEVVSKYQATIAECQAAVAGLKAAQDLEKSESSIGFQNRGNDLQARLTVPKLEHIIQSLEARVNYYAPQSKRRLFYLQGGALEGAENEAKAVLNDLDVFRQQLNLVGDPLVSQHIDAVNRMSPKEAQHSGAATEQLLQQQEGNQGGQAA